MRIAAIIASALAMALVFPPLATATHPAGPPAGASGVAPPAAPDPPPSISGAERDGAILTGAAGGWSGSPTFAYDWLQCDAGGANCAFAHDNDLSYALTAADVGKTMRLRVRAAGVAGSHELDSAPTGVIAAAETPVPPSNNGAPQVVTSVGGSLTEGQYIFAYNGSWVGTPPPVFAVRWERCDRTGCTATATGPYYLLGPDDVGMEMRIRVIAFNAAGSATAFSALTGIVAPRVAARRKYKRIKPFPRVAIGGFLVGRGVRLDQLSVRAPRGSALEITCRGRDCPFRRALRRMRGRSAVVRSVVGRTLRAGTIIELRVTQPGKIGKYTRFIVRRGSKPARIDRCLVPGRSRPARCP